MSGSGLLTGSPAATTQVVRQSTLLGRLAAQPVFDGEGVGPTPLEVCESASETTMHQRLEITILDFGWSELLSSLCVSIPSAPKLHLQFWGLIG